MRRALTLLLAVALVAAGACSISARPPLRIGAVYPLSGSQGEGGVDEYQGVLLAAQLVNHDGGVNGRSIELVPVDVPSADAAPEAIASLDRRGIRLVLGTYGSTISSPAADAAARRGMLFWETGAVLGRNAIAFVGDEYAPVLGVAPSTLRYAVTLVDDAYGRSVARGALDELEARGYPLVAQLAYDPRTVDMAELVRDLAASDPDVLFVSAYLEDAVEMRREMVAQGLDLAVGIGTSSSYCMPQFGAELGEEAVGLFASDKPDADALNADGLTPDGRALLGRARAAFEERFGAPMGAAALAGFSAAWALLHDVLPAATEPTPAAVAAAANDVDLPEGSLPNGSGLRFGPPGTATAGANVLASSIVWQWQEPGEHVAVWPARYATHPIEPIDPLP
ncbi:MAG: ABC transporter substrate-binding protein [Actinomycetota bacterium]